MSSASGTVGSRDSKDVIRILLLSLGSNFALRIKLSIVPSKPTTFYGDTTSDFYLVTYNFFKNVFPISFAAKCSHVTKCWTMKCKGNEYGQMLGFALKDKG